MDNNIITSLANPICKEVSSLKQRKHRRETGLFVLEGIRGIRDALAASWKPEYVLTSGDFDSQRGAGELAATLAHIAVPGYRVPSPVMKKLSETETPQGILAVFQQPQTDLKTLLERERGFWLILDRIQDPGNLGTLIRSGEAAGVAGVLLTHGTTDPYSAKALRSSTGAVLHLPVVELPAEISLVELCQKAGIHLVAAALEGGVPYHQTSYQLPLGLIIGNEANGIDPSLLDQVPHRVTIPMKGNLQSLNAAIAGSILLFHMAQAVPCQP